MVTASLDAQTVRMAGHLVSSRGQNVRTVAAEQFVGEDGHEVSTFGQNVMFSGQIVTVDQPSEQTVVLPGSHCVTAATHSVELSEHTVSAIGQTVLSTGQVVKMPRRGAQTVAWSVQIVLSAGHSVTPAGQLVSTVPSGQTVMSPAVVHAVNVGGHNVACHGQTVISSWHSVITFDVDTVHKVGLSGHLVRISGQMVVFTGQIVTAPKLSGHIVATISVVV